MGAIDRTAAVGERFHEIHENADVSSAMAELSSISTGLEELSKRVTVIAESFAGSRRDDLAAELYRVERALGSASRTLARVVSTEP